MLRLGAFSSHVTRQSLARPRLFFERIVPSMTHGRCLLSTDATTTAPPVTLGILRETYNGWERRAPLTPKHVNQLINENDETMSQRGVRVVIQPCQKRIFEDKAYEAANAIVQEDLSGADIIMSVKRPADASTLIPNKTFLTFSHTIKGQPENMDLLNMCLEKKVQLIDYEKILKPDGKRLVSFGRFAGLAGAIDTLHGLGKRLHSNGSWTPFSVFPQTIYKDDLASCMAKVDELAETIAQKGTSTNEPLVIAVTGKGGSVFGGAMEIFERIPHEIVSVEDLPNIHKKSDRNKIFIVPLSTKDMFERDGGGFDRADFGRFPENYHSNFHENVLPFSHVVVNTAYWDDRFPRILTKQALKELVASGNDRFLMLSDLSCDVNGSFEFLEKTTCIEKPFFQYNPLTGRIADEVTAEGITVLGVDILPTQLPKESSNHFADKLLPVVKELIQNLTESNGVQVEKLSDGVRSACITNTSGALENDYRFLEQFLSGGNVKVDDAQADTMVLHIWGHLFDTGLINHIADAVVDDGKCMMTIENATVPPAGAGQQVMSSISLRITTDEGRETLDAVEKNVRDCVAKKPEAQATMTRKEATSPTGKAPSSTKQRGLARVEHNYQPKVLVLGSGFVAKTAVSYLDQHTSSSIQVASNMEDEAQKVASVAKTSSAVKLDTKKDPKFLLELVQKADIVLSLVPADMHIGVAEACLESNTNLVTCSYVSPEMKELGNKAKEKGIVFLNEQGLDPGLDHMSAMNVINEIKQRGGHVESFSSVCGGLPAPECIGEGNPLQYKFSWSPQGVLRASRQNACYRHQGEVVRIPGEMLLGSAKQFTKAWPELSLDVVPNRNALAYESIYGLEDADTIFRGTLRYRGFAEMMRFFSNVGLLSSDKVTKETWSQLFDELAQKQFFNNQWEFFCSCANDADLAGKALVFMNRLGITGSEKPGEGSIEEAFCRALAAELTLGPEERDMVLMHHDIVAEFEDGTTENHTSTLKLFGDEQASAMAKTVGFTAGAAVSLVLEGGLEGKSGIVLPTVLYEPILDKVGQVGITFEENVDVHPPEEYQTS